NIDGTWIDLNDLEYSTSDSLKSYLFIGTDHSGNESAKDDSYQGSMADFLLLMILNKTNKTYGFIQLNRDTMTGVYLIDDDGEPAGVYEEQLCTAHWYGRSRQQSCLNTVDTVSDLLGGLTIDGYYSVGMDDIAQLNHIIGGATVTIEDDFSKSDPSLVKGETVTLTDEQAYNYLHARMDVGDGENTSRMRRQRTYMEAVYDKVIDRVKSEKNFLDDITDTLGDSVTTNMNGDDFGQIRNVFRDGVSLGINEPDGETTVGTKLDDGLEHTEFYMDVASLAKIMIKLCNLKIDEFTDWDDLETETEVW
ncbi:MAG: LCP family protein, partial [Lachnospiraceae bacterium]|nr:LCP family protein [Lachnospiraceae bacterium]